MLSKTPSRLTLLAGFGLCASTLGLAAEKPAVRWLTLDFPPYHIASGPQQGQGIRDRFLKALQTELPQFAHVTEFSSVARQNGLMQSGEPVCSLSLLRTPEREAAMLFSQRPYGQQLPVRLITLAATAERHPQLQQESVSLKSLLNSTSLKLGAVEKRRFGKGIDETLDAAPGERVLRFNSDTLLPAQIRLIERGRFDMTLGYTVELEALRASEPGMVKLSYLPLKEAEALIPVYVSCSRSPTGEAILAAIDALPANLAAKHQMRRDYEAFLPEIERARFRNLTSRHGEK